MGVRIVGDFDGDGVEARAERRRSLTAAGCNGSGLEAEQVVVMDVVGEGAEAFVEALLGGEVDVLAAGLGREGFRGVVLDGVDGYEE